LDEQGVPPVGEDLTDSPDRRRHQRCPCSCRLETDKGQAFPARGQDADIGGGHDGTSIGPDPRERDPVGYAKLAGQRFERGPEGSFAKDDQREFGNQRQRPDRQVVVLLRLEAPD